MTRAVIYQRVSDKKQATEDKTSMDDQVRHCEAYAGKQGWSIVGVYSDVMTGYDSLQDRPGLGQVRDVFARKGADVLLVWKFDRLARETYDMGRLYSEVSRAGGRLVSVQEGELENTTDGKLFAALRGYMAEKEREGIAARMHGGIRTRAEMGGILCGGAYLYGYRRVEYTENGKRLFAYAENDDTAPVVRRMYQLAEDGCGTPQIADILNAEGILTPSVYLESQGHPRKYVVRYWSAHRVYKLLTDSNYKGVRIAYGYERVSKGTMRQRDEDDPRCLHQTVPALVTPDQWQRVQDLLAGRYLGGDKRGTDYLDKPLLLKGLAVCEHCGSRLTIYPVNGSYAYVCTRRAVKDPEKKCPGGYFNVKASLVDADVWAKVETMAGDTDRFRRMVEAPLQRAQDRIQAVEDQHKQLQADLTQVQADRDKWVRRIEQEDDDDVAATYRLRLKDVLATIKTLKTRTDRATHTQDQLTAYFSAVMTALALVGQPTLTREDKRRIMRALNVRAVVYNRHSEYAQTHDTRWDFQLDSEKGVPETSCQPDVSTLSKQGWERLATNRPCGRSTRATS